MGPAFLLFAGIAAGFLCFLFFLDAFIYATNFATVQLENWQQSIIEEHPKDFWLGLYHSDGSRYKQTNANVHYYNFTQKSEDITKLFMWCSNLLGIKYKKHIRSNNINVVNIYDRASIVLLDTFAGPKT